MNYYLDVLRQWKDFEGRADRREYWMFVLINFGIAIVISGLDSLIFSETGTLSGIYALILFVPGIAVTIRRLHDIGKSGWWQLVIIIPLIGWIWFLILMAKEGESGSNKY